MCEALRQLMSDELTAERNVGGQERQDQIIQNMIDENMSADMIARIAEVPVAYVKNFGKKASAAT